MKLRLTGAFAIAISAAISLSPTLARATNRECATLFKASSELAKTVSELGFDQNATVRSGRIIYYEQLPAKKGHGTAIVFMGLFTPLTDYIGFKQSFARQSKGEGLIIFDYASMPQSLSVRAALDQKIAGKVSESSLNDIVADATAVINEAGVRGPVTAIGYSFGSAPATAFAAFHRARVSNLVFVSPFVIQGEHDARLMQSRQAIEAMAALNTFFGPAMLDSARAHAAYSIAELNVKSLFDSRKWPEGISRQNVFDGILARIRATDTTDLRRENFAQLPTTTFLLGEKENALRLQFQDETVKAANDAAAKRKTALAKVVVVKNGSHAVLLSNPDESASMILEVMRRR